jgi:hypothetical protein
MVGLNVGANDLREGADVGSKVGIVTAVGATDGRKVGAND